MELRCCENIKESSDLKIKNVTTKQMILDLISFKDGYNIDGSRTYLTNISKENYMLRESIIKKLAFCIQIGFTEVKNLEGKDLRTAQIDQNQIMFLNANDEINLKKAKKDGLVPCAQRYLDTLIIFKKEEIKMLQDFFSQRENFGTIKLDEEGKKELRAMEIYIKE